MVQHDAVVVVVVVVVVVARGQMVGGCSRIRESGVRRGRGTVRVMMRHGK